MTNDDLIKITLGTAALLSTAAGWFVTYRHSRETQLRKDRLELINRQLSELYGPLFISCVAGKSAYQALLAKLGLTTDSAVFGRDAAPTADMIDEWALWMEHVFVPLNNLREKIVLEKLHLMRESDRQATMAQLEQLVAHVSWCRVMMAKWKRDKDKATCQPRELYPLIEFPRDLERPIGLGLEALRNEQATLLMQLEPKEDRGLIRLGIWSR